MYVPGETRTAQIRLSQDEIQKARADAILKMPYIILAEAEGLIRYAKTPVRIKMPPPTDPLNPETINQPRLGIVMSVNLQGKYDVRILNETEVTNPLKIRATAAAKQAYESMRFQMILEIDDEDVRQDAPQSAPEHYQPSCHLDHGAVSRMTVPDGNVHQRHTQDEPEAQPYQESAFAGSGRHTSSPRYCINNRCYW